MAAYKATYTAAPCNNYCLSTYPPCEVGGMLSLALVMAFCTDILFFSPGDVDSFGFTRPNCPYLSGAARKSDNDNVHLHYDLCMSHGCVSTTLMSTLSCLAVRVGIVVRARPGGTPFNMTDTTLKVYH